MEDQILFYKYYRIISFIQLIFFIIKSMFFYIFILFTYIIAYYNLYILFYNFICISSFLYVIDINIIFYNHLKIIKEKYEKIFIKPILTLDCNSITDDILKDNIFNSTLSLSLVNMSNINNVKKILKFDIESLTVVVDNFTIKYLSEYIKYSTKLKSIKIYNYNSILLKSLLENNSLYNINLFGIIHRYDIESISQKNLLFNVNILDVLNNDYEDIFITPCRIYIIQNIKYICDPDDKNIIEKLIIHTNNKNDIPISFILNHKHLKSLKIL